MSTSLEQIHKILAPYLSDESGVADLPSNLLELLEDTDDDAKYRVEQIEGMLALYAGRKISRETLRNRLVDLAVPSSLVIGEPLVLENAATYSTATSLTTPQQGVPFVLGIPQVEIGRALEYGRVG